MEPWGQEPWNLGTLKPWTPRTLEPWNPGTGILELRIFWKLGTLEHGSRGTLEHPEVIQLQGKKVTSYFGIDLAIFDAFWLFLEIVLPQPLELDVAGLVSLFSHAAGI